MWARSQYAEMDAAEEEKAPPRRVPPPRALRSDAPEVAAEKERRQAYTQVVAPYGVPVAPPAGALAGMPGPLAFPGSMSPRGPAMISPRAMHGPPMLSPRTVAAGLSPPRHPADLERGPEQATRRRAEEADRRWLAEEDRIRAGVWRQEEMLRVENEERQRRIARAAMVAEPFSPRQAEQEDEAHMMARWAQMVQSTVDSTERALAASTAVAAEAGRNMRNREAEYEREKELAHEYLVREVETTKQLASREREKAFEGRVHTTKAEQTQAEQLASQRIDFEEKALAREARHREAEAARRDAQERWRLRRKEREEISQGEERIERSQKEEASAIAAARRAEDLQRVITSLDAAQRQREEALARREAEQEEQRRYRQRREAELEAAQREEAELADNMISNLDAKYREQEQTAVALRVAEAAYVDRSVVERESRTRAPFRADRAAEYKHLLEEVEAAEGEDIEVGACALSYTEGDMERRARAAYRLHRGADTGHGDQRTLRSQDYRYGGAQTGGPEPTRTDAEVRAKMGGAQTQAYDAVNQAAFETADLAGRYAQSAYTYDDAASQTRPRPVHAQIHNTEEFDFAPSTVAGTGGTASQDRALVTRAIPEGRLFAGVLTPRQEMEAAREARHTLKREEERTALEAARARREQAEYTYSARQVHFQQLKARSEQYLAEATPSLAAAQAAASSITPGEVLDLASGDALPVVQVVVQAVGIMLTGDEAISFEAARELMLPPERYVDLLRDFNSASVGTPQIEAVHNSMRVLDVDEVLGASPTAAALLMWTANMARYNQVYANVCPVRLEMAEAARAMEEADTERREAAKKLSFLKLWRADA